jgi:3-oxoadipate enol-lactonase
VPHVLANGISTHYKTTPAGRARPEHAPTAVFVHGLGTDSLASFYLTLAAPLAAAGINVMAYDLRGHGRSDRPRIGYTLDRFVDDLEAVLEQVHVTGPVHLVGNSFGGTVAFAYAWRHPDRVASLVSIEAEPPTEAWSSKMAQLMRFTVELLDREDTFAWITANQGSHHARLARQARERLAATDMPVAIPNGRMMTLAELQLITCPVLNVIGSLGYQADDPKLLESVLPDCRTVVLEGQDHSVLVEAHRVVRELVLEWVAEHHTPVPGDGE